MTDAPGSALQPVRTYRARWVLPIAQPPIQNGWVALEHGRIAGLGDGQPPAGDYVEVEGVLMPGLVNAHIHLELSWMRGQVPPAPSMPQWVRRLMALRRTVGREPDGPIREAVRELRAAGTAVVGDITNTFAAYEALLDSDLAAAVFRELLGFAVTDPQPAIAAAQQEIAALTPVAWLRPSIVPHAPYSVSPALLAAIAAAAHSGPVSIHLAESAEEGQFLEDGSGPWRELLTESQRKT